MGQLQRMEIADQRVIPADSCFLHRFCRKGLGQKVIVREDIE